LEINISRRNKKKEKEKNMKIYKPDEKQIYIDATNDENSG
jgi:hypothetical protein